MVNKRKAIKIKAISAESKVHCCLNNENRACNDVSLNLHQSPSTFSSTKPSGFCLPYRILFFSIAPATDISIFVHTNLQEINGICKFNGNGRRAKGDNRE